MQMKYFFVLVLFILCSLAACVSPKPVIDKEENEIIAQELTDDCQADLECFLKAVETAMLNHDEAQMLEFMADGYRVEQHDTYLEGRTDQFLSEFFCGNCSITNTFACPQFDQIMSVERLTVDSDETEAVVQVLVKTPEHHVTADFFVFLKLEDGKRVFRLVGAVG